MHADLVQRGQGDRVNQSGGYDRVLDVCGQRHLKNTAENVKLLLPPRQSRELPMGLEPE